uniref:Putative fatty acyl CoA synthetase 4 n=1 Tax=Trypanosoma congolense (strain IL3000) TaxID=1068625 RepID=G0UTM4_TRYCI|nr:putative fatty acyl CoA synthetase 4 [Trypanosoma congolense IL3000]
MGGCVLSVMDHMSSRSEAQNQHVSEFRAIGKVAAPLEGTEAPNSTPVYRLCTQDSKDPEAVAGQWYNSDCLPRRLASLCKRGEKKRAVAYRPVVRVEKTVIQDVHTGAKKTVNVTHFKDTEYLDRGTFWEYIESFGRGLVELGIPAKSMVTIYEETRWEWLATIYGIWSQGMIATTVYSNLGEDALAYALRETGSHAIICNAKNVELLVKFMIDGVIPDTVIIYNGDLPTSLDPKGCRLMTWKEVVNTGRSAADRLSLNMPSNPDDLALIMYTSGTTGDPKGVMHSHGSLAAGVDALNHRLVAVLGPFEEGESYCAYLPLAHILELGVLNVFMACGALICFGTPFTLTDLTAKPRGDLVEFNPVLLIGVPRIYDTLKKAIQAKLPLPGSFKRRVFDHAFKSRLEAYKNGIDTPYWESKVFAATRSILGNKMRMVLSGGGPLSQATEEFVNVMLARIIQGWGLTETVCIGGVQLPGDIDVGVVGPPLMTEEVKLLDVEGYKHTDQPEPRGEILIRGPFLFKGYYKQEALTKEAIDADGWFHTGDVGSIGPNGTLRIIGRVKALAKNVLGEYIAMEALESMYAQNSLSMPNGVCILVHPDKSYICALVLTDESKVVAFTKEHGLKGKYPDILQDPAFQKRVTESFQETARLAERQKFECVRHVRLLSDEWTPENGVLTAAGKLKRRVIDERYADLIGSLFVEE